MLQLVFCVVAARYYTPRLAESHRAALLPADDNSGFFL
jgi:hypothetical protein